MRTLHKTDIFIAILIIVAVTAACGPRPSPAPATLVPAPPVTESSQIWGDPGLPGTSGASELEKNGYVREEIFMTGKANVYGAGPQGALPIEQTDVPYTTRLVVIRPLDPARFSGNVHLTPFHPMLGTPAWGTMKEYAMSNGDAYVGVMTGGDSNSRVSNPDPPVSAPVVLKWFDPQRYEKINWPEEDGIRWGVFAQTAAMIRRADGPLATLTVQRVYASGWSFTGSFLRTFINEGFHDASRDAKGRPLIDGYLLGISSSSFTGGYVPINSKEKNSDPEDPRRRNKPIDVPVIELMSENEAVTAYDPQTPDKDSGLGRHRLYQVGGLTHGGGGRQSTEPSVVDLQYARKGTKRAPYPGQENGDPCGYPQSDIEMRHFGQAALANLDRWVRTNEAPTRAPRLELDTSYKQIRDEFGNVRGGLRPAQLEVPLARYGRGPGEACEQKGFPFLPMRRVPLAPEQLEKLYPGGKAEYLKRFDAAVDRLLAQRFILAGDAETVKKDARAAAEEAFSDGQSQARRPPIMPLPEGAPPPKAVPLGPYQVTVETDPSLPTHTVYRPTDLSPFEGGKLPIVAWGNGGCIAMGRAFESFLIKIASHGFVIVAIGPENATPPNFGGQGPGAPRPQGAPQPGEQRQRPQMPASMRSSASQLLDGIDWAIAQNSLPGGLYSAKLNPDAVAVMGQSCGGMQAISVSGDPRVKTSVIWNSGLFSGRMPGIGGPEPKGDASSMPAPMGDATKESLKNFHAPVAYIIGGPTDIAYKNAEDDFTKIEGVPLFYANLNVGHGGTFHRDPNGGWFGEVGEAWLSWQLKGDEEAGKMFEGPKCGLCVEPAWTVKKKNMD